MIIKVVLMVLAVVYVGYSIRVGIYDLQEWRTRVNPILGQIAVSKGWPEDYPTRNFGIHNLVFFPSIIVIILGIFIYKEIMNEW